MPGRKAHGVVAAHGVAYHDHPLPAQVVHDANQVGGELLRAVAGIGRPVALPVPTLIQGNDVEPVNEPRHHRVKPV